MGEFIFITGGVRSGKSRYAEKILEHNEHTLYIATAIETDEEMQERIRLHKTKRSPLWQTYEAFKDFDKTLPGLLYDKESLLLDCVTVMITNIILEDRLIDWNNPLKESLQEIDKKVENEFKGLLGVIKNFKGTSVLVSNEVGMGLVPPYPLGRFFRDKAGSINQRLAKEANIVYFLVAGIPLKIKG